VFSSSFALFLPPHRIRRIEPRSWRAILTNDVIEADAGAAGFLSKSRPPEQLIAAIRRAAHSEILFDTEQLARIQRWREEVGQRWSSLTEREREVLTLVAQGKTDQQIAEELYLQAKTVGNHVSSILKKLNVASRTEATVWAIHEGFVDGPVSL
jgi:NarL family two-component system response regulator LiaR